MSQRKTTMKAVLWDGKPFHVAVREVPRPKLEAPTEVMVRVTTAAICGTEMHTYHGKLSGSDVPYILGHEAVGIITEVGEQVTKFKVGDRVVVPDGNFGSATGGKSEADDPVFLFGVGNLFGPNIGGCQAEYVKVPDADNFLLSIPQGSEHELDYLLLSDAWATAFSSITATGFRAGDVVAVYGAGPVGLLAAYSALIRGASKVYSIDHVDARLEKARSIGAHPIDLRQGDPADQILELEPNGVPRTSDCVGNECVNTDIKPQENFILNNAVKLTSVGGGIAITGAYFEGPRNKGEPKQRPNYGHIEFDIAAWWLKNITISGGIVTGVGQEPALLDLINAGRANPGFVFDKIIGIDDAPEAYRLFSDHKVEKVAIDFGSKVSHEDVNGNRNPRKRSRISN